MINDLTLSLLPAHTIQELRRQSFAANDQESTRQNACAFGGSEKSLKMRWHDLQNVNRVCLIVCGKTAPITYHFERNDVQATA